MDIALCHEQVIPARGGCEHYISDLARRLARDGHAVHIYSCRWDASALPATTHFHRVPAPGGFRFLRPWRFAASCLEELSKHRHDVTMGFDKTYGLDVLYPQGGLHVASAAHNLLKQPPGWRRWLAACIKAIDPASRSFAIFERRQYLGSNRPVIIVNSRMVQRHFEQYYDIPSSDVNVLPSSIDPDRFRPDDRLRRRAEERTRWGAKDDETVGLFVAMNYRLKGLPQLIQALRYVDTTRSFRIAVVGHPKYTRYQKLARQLGVENRILFLGFRDDPSDAYFASDFLVHPTFYDPCSLVVLEALTCGLPVITSRYNGASELFTDGNEGFILDDPHDHALLGAAIGKLLEPATRSACAAAARQAAKRWTFEQHYQQLMKLFHDVVGRKQAA